MDLFLTRTVGLLGVAIMVAILARRLKLPYTVGLVITGIGLALAHLQIGSMLSHAFIFDLILPPLLFEAALSLDWTAVRRDMRPIFVLSTLGVIISAAFVTAGMVNVLHWSLTPALIFSVLIAATDPIAVIALFKDTGIKGRLRLLVESESLFNDGVAAVLFSLVISWQLGGSPLNVGTVIRVLLPMAAGGVLAGAVCAAIALALIGRTNDYLIETMVTTVAAYGSFQMAEHFHFSGVLATVTTGLVMGNLGQFKNPEQRILSPDGRAFLVAFWDFAAFIANSLVFLLIGLAVSGIAFAGLGAGPLVGIILLVLAGRALTVYPLCMLFHRTRWAIPAREQHILWWGGLRGALALALALSLPLGLSHRNDILIAAFAVVIFSVVMQGLTMPWLLKLLRIVPGDPIPAPLQTKAETGDS
jgi:CPA1 family monovalent cation:H+ antiporter